MCVMLTYIFLDRDKGHLGHLEANYYVQYFLRSRFFNIITTSLIAL